MLMNIVLPPLLPLPKTYQERYLLLCGVFVQIVGCVFCSEYIRFHRNHLPAFSVSWQARSELAISCDLRQLTGVTHERVIGRPVLRAAVKCSVYKPHELVATYSKHRARATLPRL